MTACIRSVAMSRSGQWWKGDRIRGTIGQANELQLYSGQPRGTRGHRLLPDNQSGGFVDGIGAQDSDSRSGRRKARVC